MGLSGITTLASCRNSDCSLSQKSPPSTNKLVNNKMSPIMAKVRGCSSNPGIWCPKYGEAQPSRTGKANITKPMV